MKKFYLVWYLIASMVFACVSPSEQQANKEKLMEGLKDHQVVRVTEDQVHAAAFDEGNRILNLIDSYSRAFTYWNTADGQQVLDSLNSAMNHGGIKLVLPDAPSGELSEEEMALVDAYQYSAEQGEIPDHNVQRTDQGQYLLYTFPVITDNQYQGMWSISISRKALIRNME